VVQDQAGVGRLQRAGDEHAGGGDVDEREPGQFEVDVGGAGRKGGERPSGAPGWLTGPWQSSNPAQATTSPASASS
jgi:hypothetical protein